MGVICASEFVLSQSKTATELDSAAVLYLIEMAFSVLTRRRWRERGGRDQQLEVWSSAALPRRIPRCRQLRQQLLGNRQQLANVADGFIHRLLLIRVHRKGQDLLNTL